MGLVGTLRTLPFVNAPIRAALKSFLGASRRAERYIREKWPVAGVIPIQVAGVRIVMRTNADDGIVTRCYYDQSWEVGEAKLWTILSARARAVLDVGANTGVYSLLASKLNPASTIFAFEPHPGNYRRLVENVQLNGASNVHPQPQAMGNEPGLVEFSIPADEAVCDVSSRVADFSAAHYGLSYKTVEVEQSTIDDFVKRHPTMEFELLKIDVESFELEVLRGAVTTLAEVKPLILIEVFNVDVFVTIRPSLAGKMSQATVFEIERILSDAGYHILAIGERGLLRVDNFRSIPDGGANYLVVPAPLSSNYLPYGDCEGILSLFAGRRARLNSERPGTERVAR